MAGLKGRWKRSLVNKVRVQQVAGFKVQDLPSRALRVHEPCTSQVGGDSLKHLHLTSGGLEIA